jgi:iron-sulfur cluster repair protein YtfE (RIC family)
MKDRSSAPDADLALLDAWHGQVRHHLDRLAALATRVESAPLGAEECAEACAIEAFFSGSMRDHHLAEEARVFPALLGSADPRVVTTARTLVQDHGWIEQNWLELAPQLRAVAQGHHWIEPAEFMHGAEVFLELCYEHAALEETLLPPPARAPVADAAGGQSIAVAH